MYNLKLVGYNTSMQKQLTVQIKNFHYGFIKEDFLEQYSKGENVTREHIDVTTSDKLQGVIFEQGTFNGKPVQLCVAVVEIDVKEQDFKKCLAKLKRLLKQYVAQELNCRVPVEYNYGGNINRY